MNGMLPFIEEQLFHLAGDDKSLMFCTALKILNRNGVETALAEVTNILQGDDNVDSGMRLDAITSVVTTGFERYMRERGLGVDGQISFYIELSRGMELLENFETPQPIIDICNNEENPPKDKFCELMELMTTHDHHYFAENIHYVDVNAISAILSLYDSVEGTKQPRHYDHENITMVKKLGSESPCLLNNILSDDQVPIGTPLTTLMNSYKDFFTDPLRNGRNKGLGCVSLALASGANYVSVRALSLEVMNHFFEDPLGVEDLLGTIDKTVRSLRNDS